MTLQNFVRRLPCLPVVRAGFALASAVVAVFVLHLIQTSVFPPLVRSSPIGAAIKSATITPSIEDRGLGMPVFLYWASGSGFTINLDLQHLSRREATDVWVLVAEASNHGLMTLRDSDKSLATISNRASRPMSRPEFRWVNLGTVDSLPRDAKLSLSFSYPEAETFFTEIAAIAAAPVGLSEGALLQYKQTSPPDCLVFILTVAALLAAIRVLTRRYSVFHALPQIALGLMFSIAVGLALLAAYLPKYDSTNARSGLDAAMHRGLFSLVSQGQSFAMHVLPDRTVVDKVPEQFARSEGSISSEVFHKRTTENHRLITDVMFSQQFRNAKEISSGQFDQVVVTLVLFAALVGALACKVWPRAGVGVVLVAISALSVFVSARLSQGWDELFINLRHPYFLMRDGVFSINSRELIEGTVDFLPFFLAALLSLSGIDLVTAIVALTLFGNIALVIVAYATAVRVTESKSWSLLCALVVGLSPNVVWVGGTGFTATIFAAWFLWGCYFYLVGGKRVLGLALLSTLTIVRTEGVMFGLAVVALTGMIEAWEGRQLRRLRASALEIICIALPFVLSCAVRVYVFGRALPVPISHKSTNFDSSYFSNGLLSFATMLRSHDVLIFTLIACLVLIAAAVWRVKILRGLTIVLVATGACMIPYYASGGDWFPSFWNRYAIPFALALTLFVLIGSYEVVKACVPNNIRNYGLLFLGGTALLCYADAARFRSDNVWAYSLQEARRVAGERWQRVDYLAAMGDFLKRTTPETAVIASPEVATIMYYSGREMLDLLGVSNPDVASMPLQPFTPGDILHRRRAHASLALRLPDVIAMHEPAGFLDPLSTKDPLELIRAAARDRLFTPFMVNVSYYRIGSYEALSQMGYRHFIAWAGDIFFSVFIHERIQDTFAAALRKEGLERIGSISTPYRVDPTLSKMYAPATEAVMARLPGTKTPTMLTLPR